MRTRRLAEEIYIKGLLRRTLTSPAAGDYDSFGIEYLYLCLMTGPAAVPPKVRFGVFELDLQTGELRKAGILLRLPPQPCKVLALLVSRPVQLVTREEIRDQIWGNDTVVDFEHGVNFAIKKIRDALSDAAETPRYIETLPRRGYRFIASVQNVGAEGVCPDAGVAIGPVSVQRAASMRKRWGVAALAGVFVGLIAAVAAWNVSGLRDRLLKAAPVTITGRPPRIESIAVLPFENLSGDPGQEYFADGITEELVTNLGEISGLRVISRQSVMRFKGSRKPLPEIARELRVDAIVEGTVARSGNHVHITANLLHAPTDRHLWANSYDSELADVLALQGNVARSVAGAVRIKLLPGEQARHANTRPINPEVYQAYLEGKYFLSQWTDEGLKKAAASFRRAIDLDPAYARAYEGMADVHNFVALWGLRPATEAYPLAKAAALKALELDDGLAEAHAAMGQTKLAFDWDWSGSEQELRRAIALNPNSSNAHFYYGLLLTAMGRSDEAVRETRTAVELDPLTPSMSVQLGWVLYYARRYDESIAQLRRTLELAPDFGYANMELGWNYAQKRLYPEAFLECQRAVNLMPEDQITLAGCGVTYGRVGKRQDALTLLRRLKEVSTRSYLDPYNVALLYDGLGDTDHTMEWLERAYRERSGSLYCIKVEVVSDRLRFDPRFLDLLRRMNFPQ
jgi:TolB-like protein/DNA-binding winged helix-turn-helix (wHTH) protein/Flp pilus assembly protein TadD